MGLLIRDGKLIWNGTELLTDSRNCQRQCCACENFGCEDPIGYVADASCPSTVRIQADIGVDFSFYSNSCGCDTVVVYDFECPLETVLSPDQWTTNGGGATGPVPGYNCDVCTHPIGFGGCEAGGCIESQNQVVPAFDLARGCYWRVMVRLIFSCCRVDDPDNNYQDETIEIMFTKPRCDGELCPPPGVYQYDPGLTVVPTNLIVSADTLILTHV